MRGRQGSDAARFRGAPGPIADLGCGRGEFLEALAAEGVAGIGCDANPLMAVRSKEKKLAVDQADLFTWLGGRADDSLGGVTAFQVVEHLPPASLFDLVELAIRELAPKGRVLFETINPESVYAMRWFWMDLSHMRAVPTPSLAQLLTASGFRDVAVDFRSPVPEAEGPAAGSRRRPSVRAARTPSLRPAGLRRHGREVRKVARVLVCTAQVPFSSGGAERHAEGLVRELRPSGTRPRSCVFRSSGIRARRS